MTESREARLGRLKTRSMWRGIREMDLILGRFADARIATLPAAALDALESILSENDQDLYQWIVGRSKAPDAHLEIIGRIRAFLKTDEARRPPKS